jgi:hypothetical protein
MRSPDTAMTRIPETPSPESDSIVEKKLAIEGGRK